MLTDQWFVAMTQAGQGRQVHRAERRSTSVASGEVKFVPENWVNTYNQWMKNIQDWCISRQLWWGHQIPAWYGSNGEVFVAHERGRSPGQGHGGRLHRPADARRGRAGHLVLVGAGALLDAGLAGEDAGAGPLPAVVGAGDRLRHHLLLGRPDDHDDDALHRPGALQARLHPRPGARRAGQEDEQVRGQRARPGRPDRRHRAGPAAGQAHAGPAQARDRAQGPQGHARRSSPKASPATAPMRCASPSRRWRRWAAASTSTASAARATGTSATSCGTPRASC